MKDAGCAMGMWDDVTPRSRLDLAGSYDTDIMNRFREGW